VLGLASGNIMDKTTNGGASFDTLPVPGTGNISAIEGVGNDFWFVRGSQIYRSSNSGAVWTLQFTTAFTLLAMDFVDNLSGCQMGWAAGTGGTVVKMTGLPTGTSNNQNTLPETYKLEQNYPNPFNPTTTIKYSIPLSKGVSNGRGILTRLTVTDILGRQVAVLVNGYKPAGNYSVNFDASNIPSGVYFYKLEAGDFSYVKKMVVMK
jgi:hypothetical protein